MDVFQIADFPDMTGRSFAYVNRREAKNPKSEFRNSKSEFCNIIPTGTVPHPPDPTERRACGNHLPPKSRLDPPGGSERL